MINIHTLSADTAMTIYYGQHQTPFGMGLLGMTEAEEICYFSLSTTIEGAEQALMRHWSQATCIQAQEKTAPLMSAIFQPAPAVTLCLQGSAFQQQVWKQLLNIPFASTTSYGALARQLGQPQAARAVGQAVARNYIAFLIPCHRVIRQSGELGNYRWGIARKQQLLAWEKSHAH
ncbi:methylated DNA-protein cysteine methyltransferase [Beggiatoa alba B18LD]|uniref:methylated-DNA--[protein]-cysteine S-methyltransferase n=1 Tax=Beggiatoa alba B18LD TaxID=395493 RepID=I3CKW7_9GAMM|nr:methylated-DNA--[protein]-cysteine S-methyltransferase [Beggiatoa alba]EIJ44260.1 methylated DNA-protein cysteine methyltransferase [Beggiatoa alba B18LD]